MKTSMPFRPKAQILLQLGEQLIKSESIAILELIKNSYDADATSVMVTMNDVDDREKGTIEIVDNGTGMDLYTVQNIWMEPGNTHKKEIVATSKRSALGRLPIGEKGIGRFGVHKLGKKIEMVTRSKDAMEVCVRIGYSLLLKEGLVGIDLGNELIIFLGHKAFDNAGDASDQRFKLFGRNILAV